MSKFVLSSLLFFPLLLPLFHLSTLLHISSSLTSQYPSSLCFLLPHFTVPFLSLFPPPSLHSTLPLSVSSSLTSQYPSSLCFLPPHFTVPFLSLFPPPSLHSTLPLSVSSSVTSQYPSSLCFLPPHFTVPFLSLFPPPSLQSTLPLSVSSSLTSQYPSSPSSHSSLRHSGRKRSRDLTDERSRLLATDTRSVTPLHQTPDVPGGRSGD